MADLPAALASFGALVAWPILNEADAALELTKLTDAAETALKAAFAQRGVVPLRQSETGLQIEYGLPLPDGMGARLFRFDLAMRVRAVCHKATRSWIEIRPRAFAEVVSRAGLVSHAEGIGDLKLLWQEIAAVLGRLGTPASAGAYPQTALPSVQVVFGAPLSLLEEAGVERALMLGRLTDAAVGALAARFEGRAEAPLRRSQHALALRASSAGAAEGEAQRLSIEIELQAAPEAGRLAIVPRMFGESVTTRRAGAEDLFFLEKDGAALAAFLDETRTTLAALSGAPGGLDRK